MRLHQSDIYPQSLCVLGPTVRYHAILETSFRFRVSALIYFGDGL